MNTVNIMDIENGVGFEIHPYVKNKILKDRLQYNVLDGRSFSEYVLEYLKVLDADLSKTGEHRKDDWEKGWDENLDLFRATGNIDSLIPKYHTKSNIARLNNKIIQTIHPQFDFKIHSYFVDAVLMKYLPKFRDVCEFGCGTGYHLFRLKQEFPSINFIGLDWSRASQKIINEVSTFLNADVSGKIFDYYNPDYSFDVKDKLIYTVASLEQVGENHGKFIDYLIEKKPGLCIHFEPISEVFRKDDNLLDYLTSKYFEKRNYLKGFLLKLDELESQGKVEILETRRLNYGSKFIEGHTLIIWKPL